MHHWTADAFRVGLDGAEARPIVAALLGGGDARLALDACGVNKYLCPPLPTPHLACLSSCTASPISEAGWVEASAAYGRIAAASPRVRSGRIEEIRAGIATTIRRALGLDPSVQVILTPSGTDGLLLAAVLMALETRRVPLTAILPSAAETGSGVPQAVACRAFDGPEAGRSVLDRDVDVVNVQLRGPDGETLAPDRIGRNYEAACRAARGRPVVYLTHGSKTGLVAPAEVPEGVDVVVDACQLRLRPSAVKGYLARGWPVVITGSKFLGGPAFCGAVLLPDGRFPERLRARAEGVCAGLRASSGSCISILGEAGPLLRWTAALAGLGGAAPIEDRTAETLDRLGRVAAAAVAALPGVRVMEDGGAVSGIVTLAVEQLDRPGAWLSTDELRPLYWRLAEQGVLLGQPVDLGPFGGLRAAIGLRDVLAGSVDASLRYLAEAWPLASRLGGARARAA